jgi:hypothetical protein
VKSTFLRPTGLKASEEIMDADVNHDAFERWWAATPESKLELIDGQSCPI